MTMHKEDEERRPVMPTHCKWCGQPIEVDEGAALPSEPDDDEEKPDDGLCVVCQMVLDATGTLLTYQDPTLQAMVDEIQQHGRDMQRGA